MTPEEIKVFEREALRRARLTSIILGFAALITVISMLYGFTQSIEAEKQSIIAQEQRERAVKQESQAAILQDQLTACQAEKIK